MQIFWARFFFSFSTLQENPFYNTFVLLVSITDSSIQNTNFLKINCKKLEHIEKVKEAM